MTFRFTLTATLMFTALFASDIRANEFHPDFPLLDALGEPVIHSGQPLSTTKTCGECHDVRFIHESSDHADAGASRLDSQHASHPWSAGRGYFGGWDPMAYDQAFTKATTVDTEAWLKRYGTRHVGGGPVNGHVEMACLLCHGDVAGSEARAEALGAGDFAWANSAPLSEAEILAQTEGGWQWNPWAFLEDGRLAEGLLAIRKPAGRELRAMPWPGRGHAGRNPWCWTLRSPGAA